MAFNPEKLHWLTDEIDSAIVSRRTQGRDTFLFIEGHILVDQMNRFSNFGWRSRVKSVDRVVVECEAPVWENGRKVGAQPVTRTVYHALVALEVKDDDGEWIAKEDGGTAISVNASPEAHDMAFKGAITDGMKRAARQFGNQFGNSLYDKNSEENEAMKVGRPTMVCKETDAPTDLAERGGDASAKPSTCEEVDCHAVLGPYVSESSGNLVSVEQQVMESRRRFGIVSCQDHFVKRFRQSRAAA